MPTPFVELLKNLIDYAGLFPPARLPLDRVLRNFADYQACEQHWMLGTLILRPDDLSRLGKLGRDLMARAESPWRIACVLPGGDESQLRADLSEIQRFNASYSQGPLPRAGIDTVELRIQSTSEMLRAANILPVNMRVYFEMGYEQAAQLIPVIAEADRSNLHAKFRTGGISADLIPMDEEVIDAISRCADGRVRFKATAGLHHPVRGAHPLTYEQNAESSVMHGFLNVLAATAILMADPENKDEACRALRDRDANSFRVAEDGWYWRQRKFSLKDTVHLRTHGMVSFGSCSFVEPVEDLQNLDFDVELPRES